MSFSGSPDSERSTNRMFGLAETESDCTALRSPPLFTFSGAQPCSTAIGRRISAVASSQTKAEKGSRSEAPRAAWKGAFIYSLPLFGLQAALEPGHGPVAIGGNRLGGFHRI